MAKPKRDLETRRSRAFTLRARGYSYMRIAETIASELNQPRYGKSQAHSDVKAATKERDPLSVDCWRELDSEAVNSLLAQTWGLVDAGDDRIKLKAIALATRLIDMRCKVHGTYAVTAQLAELIVRDELSELLERLQQNLTQPEYDRFTSILNAHETRKDSG